MEKPFLTLKFSCSLECLERTVLFSKLEIVELSILPFYSIGKFVFSFFSSSLTVLYNK